MVTSFDFADISALVGTDVVVPPTVTGTGCTVNLDTLVVLQRERCPYSDSGLRWEDPGG